MQIIKELLLLFILHQAASMDLRSKHISNRLICFGLFAAITVSILFDGVNNILMILINIILPVIIYYPLFLAKVIGAGDVKLFSVVSSFIGIQNMFYCSICTLTMAGMFGLFVKYHNNVSKKRTIIPLGPWILAGYLCILAVE